jgi:hypothetical protein
VSVFTARERSDICASPLTVFGFYLRNYHLWQAPLDASFCGMMPFSGILIKLTDEK